LQSQFGRIATAAWKSCDLTLENLRPQIEPTRQLWDLSYRIVLRPERGYLETTYDDKLVRLPKSLRPQFGQKYDAKKVRNR
jgi:hypothetical protein